MTDRYDDAIHRRPPAWTQRVDQRPPGQEAPPIAPDFGPSPQDGEYRAYGVTPTDDLESCDIAWWLGHDTPQGQEVQYRFVVRIGYVGEEQINLMLADAIISIEGRRLRDLRKRLSRGRVSFIQAFNPRIWPRPSEDAPIVERVTILYPGEFKGGRDQ